MVVFGVVVCLLAAGIVMLVLGLRGRCVNDHPVCRACGFDLVGVWPRERVCPECGGALDDEEAVVIGARKRRKGLVTGGVLLLAVVVIGGGGMLMTRNAGVNWNRYLPTGWLVARVQWAGAGAGPLMDELMLRHGYGKLSRDQTDALVADALAWQADRARGWNSGCADLLEQMYAVGDLSEEDYDAYLRGAVSLTARTRPTVHEGVDVPFELSVEIDRGGWWALHFQYALEQIDVDGVTTKLPGGGYGRSSLPGPGGSASSVSRWNPKVGVGPHEINAVWKVSAMDTPMDDGETLMEWRVESPTTVVVVPADEEIVRLVEDAAVAEAAQADLRVERVTARPLNTGGVYVSASFRSDERAIGIAMELFLVDGEREWRVGALTIPAGNGSYSASVGGHAAGFGGRVFRLELRPSARAAEVTIGMEEILGLELVYEVEVEWGE